MTSPKKAFAVILLGTMAAFFAGCATNGPKKSAIPWGQPQSWEGQIPGMGQTTGR